MFHLASKDDDKAGESLGSGLIWILLVAAGFQFFFLSSGFHVCRRKRTRVSSTSFFFDWFSFCVTSFWVTFAKKMTGVWVLVLN